MRSLGAAVASGLVDDIVGGANATRDCSFSSSTPEELDAVSLDASADRDSRVLTSAGAPRISASNLASFWTGWCRCVASSRARSSQVMVARLLSMNVQLIAEDAQQPRKLGASALVAALRRAQARRQANALYACIRYSRVAKTSVSTPVVISISVAALHSTNNDGDCDSAAGSGDRLASHASDSSSPSITELPELPMLELGGDLRATAAFACAAPELGHANVAEHI